MQKRNSNGEPEPDTIPFYSDQYVYIEPRENFYPNDVDRYTIVVWVEGDDPDCINDIIGGEMKMHLEINEEHVQKINSKYYTNITKKAQRLQLYYIIQQMLTPKNGYVNINLYRINF